MRKTAFKKYNYKKCSLYKFLFRRLNNTITRLKTNENFETDNRLEYLPAKPIINPKAETTKYP